MYVQLFHTWMVWVGLLKWYTSIPAPSGSVRLEMETPQVTRRVTIGVPPVSAETEGGSRIDGRPLKLSRKDREFEVFNLRYSPQVQGRPSKTWSCPSEPVQGPVQNRHYSLLDSKSNEWILLCRDGITRRPCGALAKPRLELFSGWKTMFA